jgi:tetratricopeptide (TPR) repeat protein
LPANLLWNGIAVVRSKSRRISLAIALSLTLTPLWGQSGTAQQADPARSQRLQQLAADQHWAEIIHELAPIADKTADLEYTYGSALAQLGHLDEARSAFLAGERLAPHDKRFAIELAGVAFKQKYPARAASYLRRALRIDPTDSYACDFVGTIYFTQDNLEAALKYWNRIDKPYVEKVQSGDTLHTRPALVDRALAFSPAAELQLADLETSQARLQGLGVFPSPRIQLAAHPDNKFDAILNLQERNGFGNNLWQGLLSTFSGIAYQTIYPEYFNIGGSAINVTSLARWDAQKRRITAELSAPLRANPRWRYRVGFDLRNENWDIRQSFTGPSPSLGFLNLRRETAFAAVDSFNSGRWGWSAAAEFSHRDYRDVLQGSSLTPDLLLQGAQLKQISGIHYRVVHAPEHRLTVNTEATSRLARIWSQPAHAFAKLEGTAQTHWLPRMQGDDFETTIDVRGGGTAGSPPFDELFELGMERDNDLWLRGHVGTRDGRKGSAPLGTRYFLVHSSLDKNVYGNGLITFRVGPFLDTGRIAGANALGSRTWQWDTGAQAKLRVLGVGLIFVYGKDLRTGNNAFYFTAGKRESSKPR